ncbi:Zn-dependent hydrolase, glyoxylase [uncultured Desulfobacterium sp.]|uniref:Zn-dependent hydrolase, glyoxylase n=1 Tax=uncultured Desulfobacterium sp. TaxID=201089 RepID=A0A445MSC5_9BACT|nr:Zn-dependent hydrolase, glyoxylase [uncultured Desulfobacterium sp.]
MFNVSTFEDVICGQDEIDLIGSSLSVFTFFVDGLLLDTGPRSFEQDSAKFFKNHPIAQVALSHVHEDHCGMASWLQKNMGVPIYLHKGAIEEASKRADLPHYRLKIWGEREAFSAISMPDEIITPRHRFEAIDTPGHCAAHMVFYEGEKGWLFTGDTFIGIRQQVAFREEDLSQTINTLNNLLTLDFDTMFCAHSGVLNDGRRLLEQKLNFLTELQEKIWDMEDQGLTIREIDRILFPVSHPISDYSEGEGTSYHMIKTLSSVRKST